MSHVSESGQTKPVRKVGFLLGVGILFLPIIFAWVTLRTGYSVLARVVSLVWMALFLLVAFGPHQPSSVTTSSSPSSTAFPNFNNASSTPSPDKTVATGGKWTYNESNDAMRGSVEKTATLKSDNELDFSFPYSGGSSGEIEIRKSARFGIDAILSISKGQFICHSFTGGHVSVKFDDGPIRKFGCNDAADGSSNVIFLRPAGQFIAEIKRSKHMVVEAEFFQEGVRQLTFDTVGLDWK